MKKLAILLTLLISNLISAQHCPYDGSSIIILKIHSREDQNTISNLKVTLIKKKKDKIVNTTEYVLTQTNRFPFLSDEYTAIVGNNFDTENWFVKIESACEYGDNGWMNYGTVEIKLNRNDIYSLCGNFDNTNYYDNNDGRVYSPIEVMLTKRSCETPED